MLDHTTLHVSNYGKAKEFYLKVLASLGYQLLMDFEKAGGFGDGERPDFWLKEEELSGKPRHVAFVAPNKEAVDMFYAAALGMGGKDNGPPGIRERQYGKSYRAFVLDPDGNNIEAICHKVA